MTDARRDSVVNAYHTTVSAIGFELVIFDFGYYKTILYFTVNFFLIIISLILCYTCSVSKSK